MRAARSAGGCCLRRRIFEDVICSFQRFVDVAELERLQPVDVAELAVGMDARLGVLERLDRIRNRLQRPVLHFQQIARFGCSLLVARHHRRDRVADVAHAAAQAGIRPGSPAECRGHREILAGKHEVDARVRFRFCDVDRLDERVRLRAAQELHVQHARQGYVVGEARLTVTLARPSTRRRGFENLHRAFSSPRLRSLRRSAGSRCSGIDCPRSLP